MQKNYRQMFEQALMKSQSEQDPAYQQLESQIMKQSAGPRQTGTLGLIDNLTGSNFASLEPKQESQKEKLSQLLQMRGQQQQQKLAGLGKLAEMQGASEEKAAQRAFQQKMYDLQLAKAAAKNNVAPKLGSEEKKSVSLVDIALDSIPKLKEAVKQGNSLRPEWTTSIPFVGDNDATMYRRNILDAISKLRSGASLSGSEEKMYGNMIGTYADDPVQGEKKLDELFNLLLKNREAYITGPAMNYSSGTAMSSQPQSSRVPSGTSYGNFDPWSASEAELDLYLASQR